MVRPRISSTLQPIAYQGKVYAINRSGVLVRGDVETENGRATSLGRGRFSSTPVIADNKMYVFNEDGVGFVVD
ncbi:MAG: hypothetical protein R3C11_06780 [Planctomycetaceae bacterium]